MFHAKRRRATYFAHGFREFGAATRPSASRLRQNGLAAKWDSEVSP
jgi:hypothetical protein